MKNKYCVEITMEADEWLVHHFTFDGEPSRDDVLKIVDEIDCGYEDDYGKIDYYEVFKDLTPHQEK